MEKFRSITSMAAMLGAVAVILGAFGAHALKASLEPSSLSVFETGVRYHFIHVIVIIMIGLFRPAEKDLILAERFMLAGIFLFSGSLYLLSTKSLWTSVSISWLGPVTPLGGLCFVLGWIFLARYFVKR